jgi:uncharacterized RDD family membrane protein YckC
MTTPAGDATPTPGDHDSSTPPTPSTPASLPQIPAPLPVPLPPAVSSVWRRIGAACIDSVVLGVAGMIIGVANYSGFAAMGDRGRFVGWVISILYFGVLNSSIGRGQTLGKRALGIVVVDGNGHRVGIGRSLLRAVVLTTPFFVNGISVASPALMVFAGFLIWGLGFGVIYLLLCNRRTRQGLHDFAAATYVLRVGREAEAPRSAIWRGHWLIIATASLVLFVVCGVTAAHFLQQRTFADLLKLQQRLQQRPEVRAAGVFVSVGTTWLNGVQSTLHYVTLNAALRHRPADPKAEAIEIANEALRAFPEAEHEDLIVVDLNYGFDIGIAKSSFNYPFNETPAHWKELGGDSTPPVNQAASASQ